MFEAYSNEKEKWVNIYGVQQTKRGEHYITEFLIFDDRWDSWEWRDINHFTLVPPEREE